MNEDKYNNQTDGQFFLKRTKQDLPLATQQWFKTSEFNV